MPKPPVFRGFCFSGRIVTRVGTSLIRLPMSGPVEGFVPDTAAGKAVMLQSGSRPGIRPIVDRTRPE